MNIQEFANFMREYFEGYFNDIQKNINEGKIRINGHASLPSNMRFAESEFHFAAEIIGSKEISKNPFKFPNKFKVEKYKNINQFINPGFIEDEGKYWSVVEMENVNDVCISDIVFSSREAAERLPKQMSFLIGRVNITNTGANVPFRISDDSNFYILRNVDLFLIEKMQFFYKSFNIVFIIRRDTDWNDFIFWLHRRVKQFTNNTAGLVDIPGLNVREKTIGETIARQLFGLANQNVDEAIIDKFIKEHADLFAKALGYVKALPQVALKIFDKDNNPTGETLKPDYLMEREDGYYDILDLKKGLLKYNSITRGKFTRIRFVSYAGELLAQLAGYQKYFDNENNRTWAENEKNIRIHNPVLYGIIGNHCNFDRDKVNEALYQYRDNVVILSYVEVAELLNKNKIMN